MKKLFLIIVCLFFMVYSKKNHEIIGLWNVKSNHYKATYKIEFQETKLVGKVIYYNDDTTVLHETGTKKDLFLFNLKKENNIYVDAVSGATNTETYATTIKEKHKDTLEVTTFIMKKPLIETWIRNTEKQQ
ncbi:hypothetical protein [Polaribacter sp. Z022]|uniref:hypothetical protein n=1 Tax=Polaribacter sp. Z022 TaxID=2927125 RepID=UPI00201FC74B|nr:hypothetical protein [Polaribacter sp. Z022]MCL7752149.1 hypothetical protein [Polaribacter sp. Z022]